MYKDPLEEYVIPAELICIEPTALIAQRPDWQSLVVKHKLSTFRLALGLKPPMMPINLFNKMRKGLLTGDYYPLLALPTLVVLSEQSTYDDIKEFFGFFGMSQDKLDKLSKRITYEDVKNGRLKPPFDETDLESLKKRKFKYSILPAFLNSQSDTRSIKAALVSCGVASVEDIRLQIPSIMLDYEERQASMKSKSKVSLVNEYCIAYQNHEVAICKNLAQQLIDRFKETQDILSPMVHFTNASGTGKTRAAMELAKLTNVVYFKLGQFNGLPETTCLRTIMQYFHKFDATSPVSSQKAHLIMNLALQRLLYMAKNYCMNVEESPSKCLFADKIVMYNVYGQSLSGYTHEDVEKYFFEGADAIQDLFVDERRCYDRRYERQSLDLYNELKLGGLSIQDLNEINEQWLSERKEKLLAALDPYVREYAAKLPPLIFVFDEAHHLTERNQEAIVYLTKKDAKNNGDRVATLFQSDMYRLIRGCLRSFSFYWNKSLTLTISVMSHASIFNPPLQIDPSIYAQSPDNLKMHPSIVHRCNHDVFHPGPVDSTFTGDWMQFLFSLARVLSIITCGRPMWSVYHLKYIRDHVDKRLPNTYEVIVQDSSYKLELSRICLQADDVSHLESKKLVSDEVMVTILSLSVALNKRPATVLPEDLVLLGGMTLFEINDQKAKGYFCPEGIFNGFASVCLVKNFDYMISRFKSWIIGSEMGTFNAGEIGEIIDRILLIRAVMTAKRQSVLKRYAKGDLEFIWDERFSSPSTKSISEMIFEPVGIEDFLSAYAGATAATKYLLENEGLKGSFVAFSHFVYMAIDDLITSPYDVAANLLARGAALATKSLTPGVDTLIPLVLSDGKLSFLYIQTKLGSSFRPPTAAKVASSSPENKIFWLPLAKGATARRPAPGLLETTPAYGYIYRVFKKTRRCTFEVFPKGRIPRAENETGPNIEHLPCLSIFGLDDRGEKGLKDLQEIIYKICKPYNFEWTNWAASLKNTWMRPREAKRSINIDEINAKVNNNWTEFETGFKNISLNADDNGRPSLTMTQ